MDLRAVIFDLNGTVLDDEDEYGVAFGKVLQNLGVKVTGEVPHTTGIGVAENWPRLILKYGVTTEKSIDELAALTQHEYIGLLSTVTLKPGFEKFASEIKSSGLNIALATSNTYLVLDEVFKTYPIEKYFDVTTTAEEVESRKPAPDLFLVTAEKLGIDPRYCVVFEDAKAGIDAARQAGMKVVGIALNEEIKNDLKEADLIIKDFTEITTPDLFSL